MKIQFMLIFTIGLVSTVLVTPLAANKTKLTSHHSIRQIVDEIAKEVITEFDLTKKIPESLELIKNQVNKTRQCYDSSIGNKKVNIFTETIGSVLKQFANHHIDLFKGLTKLEFRQHVQAFLGNVIQVAKSVIACIRNKDPKYIPTKLGLSPLHIYTEKQFREKFTPTIHKKPAQQSIRLSSGGATTKAPWPPYDPCWDMNKNGTNFPEEFDWRKKGVVTPVMEQGCGDCYVHAGASAIESHYVLRIPDAKLEQFSRQDMLNCVYGNFNSCRGGDCVDVWDQVQSRGLELEKDEPYIGKAKPCKENGPKVLFPFPQTRDMQYCEFGVDTHDELKAVILRYGPMKVSMNVNVIPAGLKGPFNDKCTLPDPPFFNHQVFLVGWTKTHFIIKNSWGTSFGVDGYLHVRQDEFNPCGILGSVAYVYWNNTMELPNFNGY